MTSAIKVLSSSQATSRAVANVSTGASSASLANTNSLSYVGSVVVQGNSINNGLSQPDLMANLVEFTTKGILKKLIFAYLGSKLPAMFAIKHPIGKWLGAIFGFSVLGSLFTKLEEIIQYKIKRLLDRTTDNLDQNNWHLSDLMAKTLSMSILSLIGSAKKGLLMNHSFHDQSTQNELGLSTKLTVPFEWLIRKLKIGHENFRYNPKENILENFESMSAWFHSLAQKTYQKTDLNFFTRQALGFSSNSLGLFSGQVVGWPNWRASLRENKPYTKTQMASDVLKKFVVLVPLGVLIEYIGSLFHKSLKNQS